MQLPGRLLTRLAVVSRALPTFAKRRRRSPSPRRILVAHHPKMIGDLLMLTPLVAKLRSTWPDAQIVITASRAVQPLYAARPYGVEALAFDPRDPATFAPFAIPHGYDLAIVPGDNRYGWFARAAGARWVIGFAGDRPAYKNGLIDELHPFPAQPAPWGEMAAALVDGPAPAPYAPSQWTAPPCDPFDAPVGAYAVIHLGASSALKRWPAERWRTVATQLEARGLEVVWSTGPGEGALAEECDAGSLRRAYAGTLDLAQVWKLLAGARLLLAPDTGVAHIARATCTPTVSLVGPGAHQVVGPGRFWADCPAATVVVDPFPCRDQHRLFKREVAWVNRCERSTRECPVPRCMHAIGVAEVLAAADALLARCRS